ncbi:hypothetical protein BDV25DRAFT_137184 [Aspergillus avenaceus]|uniref:Integral membrane protein n=1 Tax=Aspergillus avenaceus TaxID=36643 RepID=A0A5N6U4E9_ASPAV|nr:hypothetical protein BDV25DRAFT_137184 [Aspergillus avenaceus]
MALRGSGYESGSCSSNAFRSKEMQILVAFHALFFLVFLALFAFAAVKFFRSQQKGIALRRWFLFAFSIVFRIIASILVIVQVSIHECQLISESTYYQFDIARQWFSLLAYLTLVAVIMIPLCRRLVQGNRKIAKMVTLANSAYVGLLAILVVCVLGTYTSIIYDYMRLGFHDGVLDHHHIKTETAYAVLALIGMLIASANMLFAILRGRHMRKGVLRVAIPLLIVSALGMTSLYLANHIIFTYLQREYLQRGLDAFNRSLEAQLFLQLFFYAATFLSALLVASSPQLKDNDDARFNSRQPAGYTPGPHPYRQCGQPQLKEQAQYQ